MGRYKYTTVCHIMLKEKKNEALPIIPPCYVIPAVTSGYPVCSIVHDKHNARASVSNHIILIKIKCKNKYKVMSWSFLSGSL